MLSETQLTDLLPAQRNKSIDSDIVTSYSQSVGGYLGREGHQLAIRAAAQRRAVRATYRYVRTGRTPSLSPSVFRRQNIHLPRCSHSYLSRRAVQGKYRNLQRHDGPTDAPGFSLTWRDSMTLYTLVLSRHMDLAEFDSVLLNFLFTLTLRLCAFRDTLLGYIGSCYSDGCSTCYRYIQFP